MDDEGEVDMGFNGDDVEGAPFFDDRYESDRDGYVPLPTNIEKESTEELG